MREDVTVFPDLRANQMPFAMECFGTSYCDVSYQMTRACARVDVIEFVLKGTGTVVSPNGTFHPSAGDSYLLQRAAQILLRSRRSLGQDLGQFPGNADSLRSGRVRAEKNDAPARHQHL